MITINGIKMELGNFPDYTCYDFDVKIQKNNVYHIHWNFFSEDELVYLYYYVNHIREIYGNDSKIVLHIPYIPNGRMDRVHNQKKELFTLKYFTRFINSLHFNQVFVLDPHSNVSPALIDRCVVLDANQYIDRAIDDIKKKSIFNCIYVYFPDEGAMKRYGGVEELNGYKKIYGKKIRDFRTGEIKGLSIHDENGGDIQMDSPEHSAVLMIDDIVSYGGTLYHSANKLKELGVGSIFAYATHSENSLFSFLKGKLIKLIEDGTVSKLYTTNSIEKVEEFDNYNIEVFDVNYN